MWKTIRKRYNYQKRARLKLTNQWNSIHIIGDVHGCYNELKLLEQQIVSKTKIGDQKHLIIMVGDYVDKGPGSSKVIDHLIAPPPDGFDRICLLGNHDLVMSQFIDGNFRLQDWMAMGGQETLYSYGLDPEHLEQRYNKKDINRLIKERIPDTHKRFLKQLPITLEIGNILVVHAGIKVGVSVDKQKEWDLLNIRDDFYRKSGELKYWVFHGHTPVSSVSIDHRRVNVDTGAFMTGRLSAIKLSSSGTDYLST